MATQPAVPENQAPAGAYFISSKRNYPISCQAPQGFCRGSSSRVSAIAAIRLE
jgi:hypothetical protein